MNNTVSMRRINVVIQEELCAAFSVSNTSYVESCVIAPQIPDPQLCASAAVARFKQEEMNPNVIIQAFDKATNRTNPLRKAMIISTQLKSAPRQILMAWYRGARIWSNNWPFLCTIVLK